MFNVYILESVTTSKGYIGYSTNLEARIQDHQSNRANWTRNKGPWKLIFLREFENKSDALKFEIALKKTRNKRYICDRFQDYFLE